MARLFRFAVNFGLTSVQNLNLNGQERSNTENQNILGCGLDFGPGRDGLQVSNIHLGFGWMGFFAWTGRARQILTLFKLQTGEC